MEGRFLDQTLADFYFSAFFQGLRFSLICFMKMIISSWGFRLCAPLRIRGDFKVPLISGFRCVTTFGHMLFCKNLTKYKKKTKKSALL